MKNIFVSYKREDEARVGRLVRALERSGHAVWWDRGLGGGENWRQQIQGALEGAGCVVVVWSQESVGPAADFVRDEAAHAKRRGVLVPVLLDRVPLPLGFGELQTIDLTHWKGNPRDPFFGDLCSAMAAKLEGRPTPPAKGPMKRLVRRLAYGTLGSAIGLGALTFGLNGFGVQHKSCGMPLFQPHISDACGALGLGDRPMKAERLAWEHRARGSCDALRTHLQRFPDGAYRTRVGAMLAARTVTRSEVWTPATHHLTLFVGQEGPSRSATAARAAALDRGRADAERLCRGFAATASFRFTSSTPIPRTWRCTPAEGGVLCGFEGEAMCKLEERQQQEQETCGA
jgi:hypothetical protein